MKEGDDGWTVIASYTRAQALEDGMLVDVTSLAREMGIRLPTALTSAVWADYVALSPAARQVGCDETGRLWDVLWMFRCAAISQPNASDILFELLVVTERIQPDVVVLRAICGPGDSGEPVITIMLRDED